MEIVKLKLSDIHPYERNPRKITEKAVNDCAESIRQCGYKAKIIVDENNVIIAGHTRLEALKKLGWKEVEVQRETDMTEEQKQKYRLLDNKTAENGQWDYELLDWELESIDFGDYDFGFDVLSQSYIDDLTEEALAVANDNPLNTFNITLVFQKDHEDEIKAWFKENGNEAAIALIMKEVLGDA